MEENLDIIEIEGKEYAICETIMIKEKKYWIISEIQEDETVNDEVEVVRVEKDMIYGIEDEQEQQEVTAAIDEMLKEMDE